ncbi:Pyridoxine biosynthesis 2 [Hibiscus syriacus]|uniref:Pyridoxine biosynthesis 2 n=1 Tax=Hibiscus syriacus TaxID=106335 RepID=A0A6A3CQ79_HIBSY|nr:Pyridoxine biosynthesis 2 [Hibiscus syriacus]
MGCFGCFGFTTKPKQSRRHNCRPNFQQSQEFLLDEKIEEDDEIEEDDDFSYNGDVTCTVLGDEAESLGRGKRTEEFLRSKLSNGLACRQFPVKETKHDYSARVGPSETAMSDVLREVLIMKILEHPNIVNLIEVIDDPAMDQFYMVLEYVEGKWVCEDSGPQGGIGEDTARKYDENDELRRSPGTPVFTAPECCLGLTYHGKAADTWALGVTLYCMVLGHYPFLGETLQDTYDKIVNNPLILPNDMNPALRNLLEGLLCKDPKHRMTLNDVAEHYWVRGEDGPIPQYLCWCKRNSYYYPTEDLMAEAEFTR